MAKKFVIYPEKIALVDHSRILDGTVNYLDAFETDASAYLVPRRVEDGVTINYTGEAVDIEEQAENGLLVLVDTFKKRFGVNFTINVGQWTFELEALARGQQKSDVNAAHNVQKGIPPAAKVATTGIDFAASILTEKYAALFIMPPNKDDGKRLYLYMPKISQNFQDREHALSVNQQQVGLTMKALALQTSDPDELTPHQAIYTEVTAQDLLFPIEL